MEHEQARLSLREKQEEVRRLQQVGQEWEELVALGPQLGHPLSQPAFTEHLLYTRHCARHWGTEARFLTCHQISRLMNEISRLMKVMINTLGR